MMKTSASKGWPRMLIAVGAASVGLLLWGTYRAGFGESEAPRRDLSPRNEKHAGARIASGGSEAGTSEDGRAAGLRDAKQLRLESLAMSPPAQLLLVWKDAFQRRDVADMRLVVAAMGQGLRREPDADVYRALAAMLPDARLSVEERLASLDALGYAATPQAMSVVLDYLSQVQVSGDAASRDSPVERHAHEIVGRIAYAFVDGARNWAVAPRLIEAWQQPGGQWSQATLGVIAEALRYLASPEAADALVTTQIRAGPEAPEGRIAGAAVSRFTAPDVVDVLGRTLTEQDTAVGVQRSLVAGLVLIGTQTGIDYLVAYLETPSANRKLATSEVQGIMLTRTYSPDALKTIRHWRDRLQGGPSPALPVLDAVLSNAGSR